MSGACPNKVTLMKGYQTVTPGQHYASFNDGTNSWGTEHRRRMPIEEVFTQVHHFKWDSTVLERLKEVSETKEDYSYWKEYKKMYRAIQLNDWKIDVKKDEFLFVNVKKNSYICYNHWNTLKEVIVKI